jgi:hypothetical protein
VRAEALQPGAFTTPPTGRRHPRRDAVMLKVACGQPWTAPWVTPWDSDKEERGETQGRIQMAGNLIHLMQYAEFYFA